MNGSFYYNVQLGLVLFLLCIRPTAAEVPAQLGGPVVLVCRIDKPIVSNHEAVNATVFTDAPNRELFRYQWTVDGGLVTQVSESGSAFSIEDIGKQPIDATIRWDPNGAEPGAYTLSVKVQLPDGSVSGCSLDVFVTSDVRSSELPAGGDDLGREAVRALLVKGNKEKKGYGLYSYILLAARTDESNRERYAAVLGQYLILETQSLESKAPLAKLNKTYVPIESLPPEPDKPGLTWVLDYYDFGTARDLLMHVPRKEDVSRRQRVTEGDGPYVVSCVKPLCDQKGEQKCLVLNFSATPVSVIPYWMKLFRSQTTQQRVVQGDPIGTLMLNLHTWIAVAAEGLPIVLYAASSEIVQKKSAK
jgi:hypothetical protein